jgi:HEAT repeat protein
MKPALHPHPGVAFVAVLDEGRMKKKAWLLIGTLMGGGLLVGSILWWNRPAPPARSLADIDARYQTLVALQELGPGAAHAVPELVKDLADPDEDLRLNAAIALGKVGKAAVPALAEPLASPDADVRYHALSAAAWIGPDAAELTPRVRACLNHPDAGVRRKAAYALGRIGADPDAVTPALVAALSDTNDDVHEAAAAALVQYGAKAVPALGEVVRNGTPPQRCRAMELLTRIAAPESLPLFRAALKDPEVRHLALAGLLGIPGDIRAALPDVAAGLKSGDVRQRESAARLLGRMDARAVPFLIDALEQPNYRVAAAAIESARQLGPTAVLAGPALVDLARTERSAGELQGRKAMRFQMISMQTVLSLGADGLPPLFAALGQEQGTALTDLTLVALGEPRVVTKQALPLLIASLQHPAANVRRVATAALANLGHAAREAVPALTPLLNDPDPGVRRQTAAALKSINRN